MNRHLGVLFVCAFLSCLIHDPSFSDEEGGIWDTNTLSLPFYDILGSGPTTLRYENANRWRDSSSDFYLTHHQFTWTIPIPEAEGWSLEPGYRRAINQPGDRDQEFTDRYLLSLLHRNEELFGSEWDLNSRYRIERLDPEGSSNAFSRGRVRFRLERDLPQFESEGGPWRFWVFDEVFYDFNADELSTNRLAAGLDIPLRENLDLSLGFQWQWVRDETDGWEDDHMFLVGFTYQLPDFFSPSD